MASIDAERKELFEHARHVVVAPTLAWYGMARMYEILSANLPCPRSVCRSVKEAKEWLELPEDWEPPAL